MCIYEYNSINSFISPKRTRRNIITSPPAGLSSLKLNIFLPFPSLCHSISTPFPYIYKSPIPPPTSHLPMAILPPLPRILLPTTLFSCPHSFPFPFPLHFPTPPSHLSPFISTSSSSCTSFIFHFLHHLLTSCRPPTCTSWPDALCVLFVQSISLLWSPGEPLIIRGFAFTTIGSRGPGERERESGLGWAGLAWLLAGFLVGWLLLCSLCHSVDVSVSLFLLVSFTLPLFFCLWMGFVHVGL